MSAVSIAVVKSDFHDKHSTSWGAEWFRACAELSISCELVDWRSVDAFDRLRKHKVVLWHFSHYSRDEMEFARPMLAALEASGCLVFPGRAEFDHFDDKVSQAYLFSALGIRSPSNYPLHSRASVEDWISGVGIFPVVAKLKRGSGSNNVTRIDSAWHLRRYARKMFGAGISSAPGIAYKVRSNVASSRSVSTLIARAKRAPEFLFSIRNARRLGRERGYVYLQEFIPGLDFDLKIVVVGEKLGFFCRQVRKGDFRASGGGGIFFDRALVSKQIIDTAFSAADKLGSTCLGFDIVVDPVGQPLVLEISYGFAHDLVIDGGGYFDRNGAWHNSPLNAPREIVLQLVQRVSR